MGAVMRPETEQTLARLTAEPERKPVRATGEKLLIERRRRQKLAALAASVVSSSLLKSVRG
jgi:hypothetical protein